MIGVLTSGGDAPGMNAAIHAVVKLARRRGLDALGIEAGYEGLMAGRGRVLQLDEVDPIAGWGGTILGSARSAEFRTRDGRARAAMALDVRGLIVIGGNGSLTGAHLLHAEQGVPVVGIPASIDNDIACSSTAIGVDTALNTIVSACDRISDTARAHRRVFVVEVMGRDCGYLAMASSVAAGADACLFRESGKDEEQILAELSEVVLAGFSPERNKKRVLVIKAEGVQVPTQRIVQRLQTVVDGALDGVTVRATVLGHLVRGGAPSYADRAVAGRLAVGAVSALLSGESDVMVGWQPWDDDGEPTSDPSVRLFPLATVLSRTEALLDGTSEITRRRVALMEAHAGVLAI